MKEFKKYIIINKEDIDKVDYIKCGDIVKTNDGKADGVLFRIISDINDFNETIYGISDLKYGNILSSFYNTIEGLMNSENLTLYQTNPFLDLI